jgi:hypothetical protein
MAVQRNEFGLTYNQWVKYIAKQLRADKKKLNGLKK